MFATIIEYYTDVWSFFLFHSEFLMFIKDYHTVCVRACVCSILNVFSFCCFDALCCDNYQFMLLYQEVPVTDVCEAFKVARGMIQSLQENAGRFALMVSIFCERLGWSDFEGLVSKFQNRVSFGVRAEIVELTTIPYVKVELLLPFM